MTGEKHRGTTQEKLWKLDDEQLATPAHDKMVLDLLDPEYCATVLLPILTNVFSKYTVNLNDIAHPFNNLKDTPSEETIYNNCGHFDSSEMSRYVLGVSFNIWNPTPEGLEALTKTFGSIKIVDGHIENPGAVPDAIRREFAKRYCVKCSNSKKQAEQEIQQIESTHITTDFIKQFLQIRAEVPITTQNKFIVGYWDVVVGVLYSKQLPRTTFYLEAAPTIHIEVKPKIDSFGKVVRQLNMYKEYLTPYQNNIVVLFTPDTRYDKAFENQRILVISPP